MEVIKNFTDKINTTELSSENCTVHSIGLSAGRTPEHYTEYLLESDTVNWVLFERF